MRTRAQIYADKPAPRLFKRDAGIIKANRGLGRLITLPREMRDRIYELASPKEYSYHVLPNGDIQPPALKDRGSLQASSVLRREYADAQLIDRTLTVRIEEDCIKTNFQMHDLNNWHQHTPQQLRASLVVPTTCRRLKITIDPPSPRAACTFLPARQNVRAFVDILNNRPLAPHTRIEIALNRGPHITQVSRNYNDFAIFYGPFVHLSFPLTNIEISRVTGINKPSPAVNRYCARLASALRFHQPFRRDFQIQQLRIDIKLPVALVARRQFHIASHWTVQGGGPTLSTRDLDCISNAARALTSLETSNWLTALTNHLQAQPGSLVVPPLLRDAVLEGYFTADFVNWAEGLLTRSNPFFDEGMMFAGIDMARQ